ncbi:MAG: Glu-tRNA(Gln) amidotransferase subunit GatE [Thermoplasmata archaeon]|nr:Glu-tRNA(Gln) amidotransferase subunit GatE [Thermoplasmata archaeon]
MKAGLEVHQQLSTTKLFCPCPAELSETVLGSFRRTLRATGGEENLVDAAAAFQASRGLVFRYETVPSSCLVDLDEEPPRPINPEALDVALTVAMMLDARLLDEVEVMRKIVVDGSNTTGFQRTALVAVDGSIEVRGRRYTIDTVALEEDAARRMDGDGAEVGFRLDRLGVPLVEIATAPEITNGAEARAVAEEIGAVLRSTHRVRRGIGTIREDLNVSTQGGSRVEIKGVQQLRLIERYADSEEARQRWLLEVAQQLRGRRAVPPAGPGVPLTKLVEEVTDGPLRNAGRGTVVGLLLPGFGGLLRSRTPEGPRLGRELADHARSAGVRGILHSDELPGHGVSAELLERVRQELHAGTEDAIVLVAGAHPARIARAVERIVERARVALEGVPAETRDPLPDGSTRYSRPLAGRNRMYPETDVPPTIIDPERRERLRAALPERPAETRRRLATEYALADEVADHLLRLGEVGRFESLVHGGRTAGNVARLLTQELPAAAARRGPDGPDDVPEERLAALLTIVESGEVAKEAIPPLLDDLLAGAASVSEAAKRRGLVSVTLEELDRMAAQVVSSNLELVRSKGPGAFSPLMGDLMKQVRGRRDGQEVAAALRRRLAEVPPEAGSSP